MLLVRTEYKRGILFVRLDGRIDNEGYLEDIDDVIDEVGIRFIVLNISNLNDVSLTDVNHIQDYISRLEKKKRLLLICDDNGLRNSLFKGDSRITKEIEALSFFYRKDAYE